MPFPNYDYGEAILKGQTLLDENARRNAESQQQRQLGSQTLEFNKRALEQQSQFKQNVGIDPAALQAIGNTMESMYKTNGPVAAAKFGQSVLGKYGINVEVDPTQGWIKFQGAEIGALLLDPVKMEVHRVADPEMTPQRAEMQGFSEWQKKPENVGKDIRHFQAEAEAMKTQAKGTDWTTDMKNIAALNGLDVNDPKFKAFIATPQGSEAFHKLKTSAQDPELNRAREMFYQMMTSTVPQRVKKPVFNRETSNWEYKSPDEINAEAGTYSPITFSQYDKTVKSIGTLSGLNYHIDTLEQSLPVIMGSVKIAAALRQGRGSLDYAVRALANQQLSPPEANAVAAMDNLRSAMLGAKQFVGPFPIGSDERVAIENAQLPGGEAFLMGNPNLAKAKLDRLKEEIRRNVAPQLKLIEKMGLEEYVPQSIGGTQPNPGGPPQEGGVIQSKSKSGKLIVSRDGGKTWEYVSQ